MSTQTLLLHTLAQLPCFIWFALLPLLIGILIGWLLRQGKVSALAAQLNQSDRELEQVKNDLNVKSAEFTSLKYKHDDLEKDNRGLRTSLNSAQADIDVCREKVKRLEAQLAAGATGLAAAAQPLVAEPSDKIDYAALFPSTNLQIIEGIGPKIEEVLKADGIGTWSDLAAASEQQLRNILFAAGPTFRMHNPSSWPRQAQLAVDEKWEELIEYQKFLDEGREGVGDMDTPSKLEGLVALLNPSVAPDDLKIVEGIGPKIEELLKQAGINSLERLAETSVERIKEILSEHTRFRMSNPGTWPQQARLAADGKWDELREYQDYLDGGVDPADKQ